MKKRFPMSATCKRDGAFSSSKSKFRINNQVTCNFSVRPESYELKGTTEVPPERFPNNPSRLDCGGLQEEQ